MKKMDAEATYLSRFLEGVWNKKIWIVATTCVLASTSFLLRVYTTLPNQYMDNMRRAEMLEFDEREGDSVLSIFNSAKSLAAECQHPFLMYDQYYGGKDLDVTPSGEVTQGILAACFLAAQEAAKQIGTVRGMRLSNPVYVQFRDDILKCMEEMDALVAQLKAFVETNTSGSRKEKREAGQKLAVDFVKTMTQFTSAVETSGRSAARGSEEKVREMEELILELGALRRKFYATIPVFVYVVLYAIFSVRAYIRSRKPKSRIVIP